MVYADRIQDAIAVLKTDLEEMKGLSSDPELDRAIGGLEVHLDDFLDACVEILQEQEEEDEEETEQDAGELLTCGIASWSALPKKSPCLPESGPNSPAGRSRRNR